MASTKDYLYLVLSDLKSPEVTYRPMMGEYILYFKDKVIGGIYDDRLLLKPTDSALKLTNNPKLEIPYPSAKPMLRIKDCADIVRLRDILETLYKELPEPKKKK